MADFEISLENPYLMLLVIPALVVVLIPFLKMKGPEQKSPKALIPLFLHVALSVILCLIISGFSVTTETDKVNTVLICDLSFSTESVREEIAERHNEIIGLIDSEDVKGTVVFGRDSLFFAKKSFTGSLGLRSINGEGTDLAGAMEYALSLMDKYSHKRLIILSDGKENLQSALDTAMQLANEGVRIDTVYFDSDTNSPEAQICSVAVTGGAYSGDSITVRSAIKSNLTAKANVSLYVDGVLREEKAVDLTAGDHTAEFTVEDVKEGDHTFTVTLDAEGDTEERNNTAFAAATVSGKVQVLIIAPGEEDAVLLGSVLSEEAEVTVAEADKAPNSAKELCRFDAVYLMNIDTEKLPEGYGEMLDTLVKSYGKSVTFVGGDSTFRRGGMYENVYSDMLPVHYGALSGGSTALVLVIDRSGSMQLNNALELAKVGTVKALESLYPGDYMGVVAFDGLASTVVKLSRVSGNTLKEAKSAVNYIDFGGGTCYLPALKRARELLEGCEAENKQIIFLSDGSPDESLGQIKKAIRDLKADGITVNTVSIGFDNDTMEAMAKEGKGKYHAVYNAMQLPELMEDIAQNIGQEGSYTGDFPVLTDAKGDITADLPKMPNIKGYMGVHPKEDAVQYLITDEGHTLYAEWDRGKGKVAVFSMDLSDKWSKAWTVSEGGAEFIKRALKASLPETRIPSAIIPDVTVEGGNIRITATVYESGGNSDISAVVKGEGFEKRIALIRSGQNVYKGIISVEKSGIYTFEIIQKEMFGKGDSVTGYAAVPYSGEYDMFTEGGRELLSGIASYGAGELLEKEDTPAEYSPGKMRSVKQPFTLLCVICAVLLLCDIAIRKLSLKDVKTIVDRLIKR